ncbi:hypothetical protein Tsubulata_039309 [Turnera subulata]|uniref:Glycosyltransferase n=1 Tax=Turnera subulata TaxID=218843 RepID=A0A9Q0G606_9ROSI|nr:hypothetical protein Tsubulata_039309 [Turnera subulata]
MTTPGSEAQAHILIFPYPAQGHMISLLDLTHQLSLRGLTITILVTPKNLPLLNPLLSKNPSIKTLVLPFPTHPSIPHGLENCKDLPPNSFAFMTAALGGLYEPLLNWFKTHPSPPVAIISDMFLGWTHRLACELNVRRFVFSPSGAMALSVGFSLWKDNPRRKNEDDRNEVISFPKIPNCPKYPWWQISPIYRRYVHGHPNGEFIRDIMVANTESWGLVINSFTELEASYLDHLREKMGQDRVWAVGPLLPPRSKDDVSGPSERGGSSSAPVQELMAWLDSCEDHSVVYVCFGSQALLTSDQIEAVASGLDQSGIRFIWATKEPANAQVDGRYGTLPIEFEQKVAGRGIIVRGWAPQVMILGHRAVGSFLTHCGWNSVLEGLVAGVPMLAWPMGADQFVDADLLDELKVGERVCEGAGTVPNSTELARAVRESVSDNEDRRKRAKEISRAAVDAIKDDGSSATDLDGLVTHLGGLALKSM